MKPGTLKTAVRGVVCFLTLGAILLLAHLQDLANQYGVVDYFTFSLSNTMSRRPYHPNPPRNVTGDKVIVMAKMEHEDTTWVAEELPEYVELSPVDMVTVILTMHQLATSNLHCQPFREHCRRPHDECQQRP